MESKMQTYFKDLESKDKTVQYEAYNHIMEATRKEVDWAYEVWDSLIDDLTNKDNHRRSRAAQFLANLAISDPEGKMLNDFRKVWMVTMDPKFVTARHSLQSIWRVGLAGRKQKEVVIESFVHRFHNCTDEKNYTLIRYDIIQGLKNLYEATKDEEIKQMALELIEVEEDSKYKKKYKGVWK
ncbi:hypothetical protein ACFSTA_19555 [Ornithinibacillus salinisoli]|uniref:HEAT repeat domain-containing protein n=1 Tax=Ornithinibacillus salinisoli TaxID=1848459 RepID=A0ABW4W736_9BACI